MRRLLAFCLILLGLGLILGGARLWLRNREESELAGQSAEQIGLQLAQQIQLQARKGLEPLPPNAALLDQVPEMPTLEVEDSPYLGILEIPDLSLRLPVLAEYSDAGLNLAPCRYSGSVYTGDLVICGHNYASFFDSLLSIPLGTEVLFTDCSGRQWRYTVANRETLEPNEVEKMIQPSQDWSLTIFTCHFGGRTRCAVRCVSQD